MNHDLGSIALRLREIATAMIEHGDEIDVIECAEAIEANLGFDEFSGYCNCSCCDHGI